MARRRKKKKGSFLSGLACAVVLMAAVWFGRSPYALFGQRTFTVTDGSLPVTASNGIPSEQKRLLENLVTFLNKGDEFKVLGSRAGETKIQVIQRNNFSTNVTGWIPTELIKRCAAANHPF